jgi:hypothetical protein
LHTSAETKANLYARVDGKDLPYFYIYDNGPYFFEECPGKELCPPDLCDDPQLDTCKGVDAFPLFGWFATDTHTWRNGDTRTYEFGVTNRSGVDAFDFSICTRTKYIVTAKERACFNDYVCPQNSRRKSGRQCYDTFNDCECDPSHHKEGNGCVKDCSNDYLCPQFSYRKRGRQCYDTFNDCECVKGYMKDKNKCIKKY